MSVTPYNPDNGIPNSPRHREWTPAIYDPTQTLDLRAVLAGLWRRKFRVIFVALLFLALGVAYVKFSVPRYEAAAELIIDPLGLRVVNNEVNPSPQTADSNIAAVENEMRVITSADVLGAVVAKESLELDPEFIGEPTLMSSITGSLRMLLGARSSGAVDPSLVALQALRKHVAVMRAERSFAVDVIVRSRDAEKAARLANEIVSTYLANSVAARAQMARRAGDALEGRLGELRQQVSDAENRVEVYKREHNLVDTEGHLASSQQLIELNTRLTAAKAATTEANAKLRQFETLRGNQQGGISEAVTSPTLAQLRSQAAEVERRRAALAMTLGAQHPAMAAIDAELRGVNTAIDHELARIGASLNADYQRALASEQTLQQAFDKQSLEAGDASQALVRLRELEREAQANRSVYEAFLARSRELEEQTAVDSTNVRLISAATPPLRRSNVPTTVVLPLFLALGLLVGAGLAIMPLLFGRRRERSPLIIEGK